MTINSVITGYKIFKKTKWRQYHIDNDIYNRGGYIKFTGTKQLIKCLYIYIYLFLIGPLKLGSYGRFSPVISKQKEKLKSILLKDYPVI